MSRQNVEVVRRGYELIAAHDLHAVLDYLDQVTDADVELRTVGGLPDVAAIRGRAAVKAWYAELLESEAFTFEAEPEEFIDAGDAVVVPARQTAVGRESGARVTNHVVMVFGFRRDKIAYFDVFRTKQKALKAVRSGPLAGRSESQRDKGPPRTEAGPHDHAVQGLDNGGETRPLRS